MWDMGYEIWVRSSMIVKVIEEDGQFKEELKKMIDRILPLIKTD